MLASTFDLSFTVSTMILWESQLRKASSGTKGRGNVRPCPQLYPHYLQNLDEGVDSLHILLSSFASGHYSPSPPFQDHSQPVFRKPYPIMISQYSHEASQPTSNDFHDGLAPVHCYSVTPSPVGQTVVSTVNYMSRIGILVSLLSEAKCQNLTIAAQSTKTQNDIRQSIATALRLDE